VLDGDTITIDGIHVRLKGVAAPEVAHLGQPDEPGGEAAKAFMVELIEGETVVCDLTQERTHGRRVGWCYRDGEDVAEALIRAGLARDCTRFSGGHYRGVEPTSARELPFPDYCRPR
jgi:endonuclease YncB( thermonuclease family)